MVPPEVEGKSQMLADKAFVSRGRRGIIEQSMPGKNYTQADSLRARDRD